MLRFAASHFFRVVVEPVMLQALLCVAEFIADKDGLAVRAFDNVPTGTLGYWKALESPTEGTFSKGTLRRR